MEHHQRTPTCQVMTKLNYLHSIVKKYFHFGVKYQFNTQLSCYKSILNKSIHLRVVLIYWVGTTVNDAYDEMGEGAFGAISQTNNCMMPWIRCDVFIIIAVISL